MRIRTVAHPATVGGLHVGSREALLLWGAVLGPVAWRLLEVLVAGGLEEVSVEDLSALVGAGSRVDHVHAGLGALAARGLLHVDGPGWTIPHPLPKPSPATLAELPPWLVAGAAQVAGRGGVLSTPTRVGP